MIETLSSISTLFRLRVILIYIPKLRRSLLVKRRIDCPPLRVLRLADRVLLLCEAQSCVILNYHIQYS